MYVKLSILLFVLCGFVQAQETRFASDVLPILQLRCVGCHSGEKPQGGLDLTTAQALLKGGRSGPAIVAGEAARSLIVEKIVSGSMPPADPKLTSAQVLAIRSWIDKGAPAEVAMQSGGHAQAITERDVLPTFQMRCVVCHGKRKQEGGLDLRTVASRLRGGKSGPAIVPGKPEDSLLIKRIAAGEMPPPKLLFTSSVRPVTDSELSTLRRWIATGASPDPPERTHANDSKVKDTDRQFWSFQPPKRPIVPSVRNTDRVRNPIDAFLLQKLEEKNLAFSPEASAGTLLRRLYFDLIGLPPTPAQVEEFVKDRRPDAWERQVDSLLSSPLYGERWGRYWLDAVGYADSEGKVDADDIRPHAWRYRDYVIRSLNQDKPYNTFLAEQIAGDEMVSYKDGAAVTPAVLEKLAATGFWRMAADGTYSPAQSFLPERMNVLADQIEVFSSAVLGLTLNCARCHDHKYDPLPQRDYYRLSAILQSSYDPYDWIIPTKRHLNVAVESERKETEEHNAPTEREIKTLETKLAGIEKPLREKLLNERLAPLPENVQTDLRALSEVEETKRSDIQKYLAEKFKSTLAITFEELAKKYPAIRTEADPLRKRIASLKEKLWEKPQVRALYEMGGEPSATYVLRRGDALSPSEPVEPGVPSVLWTGLKPYEVTGAASGGGQGGTGRRLALAAWLTQPNHPLVARVLVNRMWMHHFGRGIVQSAANFGRTGTPPTHPELLDWLATEFVDRGWSMKQIHRLILTSAAWRQTSHISTEAAERDPENALLSRMPMQRLDADALHDGVLRVTGLLDGTQYGRPAAIEVKADGEVVTRSEDKASRRAIYLLQRRRSPVTMLEVFDTPPMSPNCIERPKSTSATQALQLMNSAEFLSRARYLAGRLLDENGADTERSIHAAYQRILSRAPNGDEVKAALAATGGFKEQWRLHLNTKKESAPVESTAQWMALGDFVHALLNSAEFSYVD